MRLTQGTKVTVRTQGVEVYEAYFQQFSQEGVRLDSVATSRPQAIILTTEGRLKAIDLEDLVLAEDNRDNLLREFIGYAAEGKVAPTDLVNETLKVVG
jgi:predicted metal-dependent RNase